MVEKEMICISVWRDVSNHTSNYGGISTEYNMVLYRSEGSNFRPVVQFKTDGRKREFYPVFQPITVEKICYEGYE